MPIKRTLILVAATVAVTTAVTITGIALNQALSPDLIYKIDDRPAFKEQQDYGPRQFMFLVRLHNSKGKFFCSGTVISDDYVLTAAHCLMRGAIIPKMMSEDLQVIGTANGPATATVDSVVTITVSAKAAALNNRADYALVKGDFREFQKARILTSPLMFNELRGPGAVCGYPWGATSVCYQFAGGLQTFYEKFMVQGRMYPGMSGGPVVDRGGGNAVFAVNSAVSEGFIIISPLIGLFETLEIEVIK